MANAADSTAGRPRLHHGQAPAQTWVAAFRERGPAIAGFVLPFALVVYLGLKGGGYDLVVRSEVGIAIWWIVLLGAAGRRAPQRVDRAGRAGSASACWPRSRSGPRSGSAGRRAPSAASPSSAASPPTLGVLALALAITGARRRCGARSTAVGAAIAVIGADRAALPPAPVLVPRRPSGRRSCPGSRGAPQLPAQLLERARGAASRSASRWCWRRATSARSPARPGARARPRCR